VGAAVPAWRSAKPGWIVLHFAIACAIAFVSLIVVIAIVSAGRDLTALDNVGSGDQGVVNAAALAFWVCFFGAQLGWMLFVYLRRPASTRAIALIVSLGAAAAAGVIVLLGALPARP
jgi:hypothetical protein